MRRFNPTDNYHQAESEEVRIKRAALHLRTWVKINGREAWRKKKAQCFRIRGGEFMNKVIEEMNRK